MMAGVSVQIHNMNSIMSQANVDHFDDLLKKTFS